MIQKGSDILQWRKEDDVAVVRIVLSQIRDPETAAALSQLLHQLVGLGHRSVLINLTKVKYLGSAGFAVLFGLGKSLQEQGGQLKVCCMDPTIRVGADIVHLGDVVEIIDTERAALKSFHVTA